MSGSFGGLGAITADQYQQAYDNQLDNYENQQSSCAVGNAVQNFMAACGIAAGASQNAVEFATDISEIIQAGVSGTAGGFSLVLTLAGKATPVGGALIAALGAVAGGIQVGEDKAIQPQLGSTLDEIAEGLAVVGVVVALAPLVPALADLALAVGITATEASVLLSLVSLVKSAVIAANDLKHGAQNAEQEAAQKNNSTHSSGANGSGANNCGAGHDPIVIDLTGNGLNITPLSQSSTYFDFNGNGFSVNTAWIGSGAGFLVIKSTNAAFGVSIGDGYEMLGTGSESGYAILQSLTAGFAYRNGFRPGAHLNAALKD